MIQTAANPQGHHAGHIIWASRSVGCQLYLYDYERGSKESHFLHSSIDGMAGILRGPIARTYVVPFRYHVCTVYSTLPSGVGGDVNR